MTALTSMDVAHQGTRKRALMLVARQIAISQGYIWQLHPNAQQERKQARIMTLAQNCVVTIEREMASYSWPNEGRRGND